MTTPSVPDGERPPEGDPSGLFCAEPTSTRPQPAAGPGQVEHPPRRRLPQRQPWRAFSVLGLYLLALVVLSQLLLVVFATALAILLLVAAAFGLSVVVAVLAPLPRPERPMVTELPVLKRPSQS